MPTQDEVLTKMLSEEIAQHGAVRPPWVRFPGVHPFDIAWRMGAGETHVILWSKWSHDAEVSDIVAAIRGHGAVPADWAWWAAEASNLIADGDDLYEQPFQEVRAKLVAAGIEVAGEPSTD